LVWPFWTFNEMGVRFPHGLQNAANIAWVDGHIARVSMNNGPSSGLLWLHPDK